jgi:hypothetical protein
MASFDLIEQLETQLLEKEQLIAALTTSLEQAANELDRAHRQMPHGPFLPGQTVAESSDDSNTELLCEIREQQAMLFEIRNGIRSLHHSPPSYQQVQPTIPDPALFHIEEQLEQIRELIEALAESQPSQGVLPTDWKDSLTQQMAKLRDNPMADLIGLSLNSPSPVRPDSIEAPPAGTNSERGCSDSSGSERTPSAAPAISESNARETRISGAVPSLVAPSSETDEERTTRLIETLPEIPAAVDIETADEETLRRAVADRDDCIQSLQDYIVALNTISVPEFDLKDYDALPLEQREKLESWEAVLRENLRRSEVEISVDRAKLAREQQKLQFQLLQLTKERKRIGMQQNLSPAAEGDTRKQGQRGIPSSRTWLSLFHRQEPTADEHPTPDRHPGDRGD